MNKPQTELRREHASIDADDEDSPEDQRPG